MRVDKIDDPKKKSEICERVLRALPQWFAIESALSDYIKDVQEMETWAATDKEALGFISVKKHNAKTAEIHIMGVLPKYHAKGIGKELVRTVEKSLSSQGFEFLTVKTLSGSRPDEYYDKTRSFYLNYGFAPIEEFKTLWGKANPCLLMLKRLAPTSYAVIFTSKRTDGDQDAYDKASKRMVELAKEQEGFIKVESARGPDGFGVTVSYWETLEDIKKWKSHSEHLIAQDFGRAKWYESFTTRICRVEREYSSR